MPAQGKVDEAVQQYEALAQRSPSGAAGARTMIGMLHEARKDRDAARRAYEQALASDPQAGVAANNLAWIYAADGKLDEALRLATTAQASLRRRPEAEDTRRLDLPAERRALAGDRRVRARTRSGAAESGLPLSSRARAPEGRRQREGTRGLRHGR